MMMAFRPLLTAVLVLALSSWSSSDRVGFGPFAQQPGAALNAFYCPMHPEITSTATGTCSRCGMKLVAGDPLDFREYLVEMTATPRAVRPGRPVRLTFTVRHPDTRAVVRNFATVHEKQYHLFVVGHDLEHYDHLHPDMLPDGSWVIDMKVPRAGYYKLFSDLLPVGGTPQVVPRVLVTAGDAGDLGAARPRLPPDDSLQQTTGSMTVSLALPSGEQLIREGSRQSCRQRLTWSCRPTSDRPRSSPIICAATFMAGTSMNSCVSPSYQSSDSTSRRKTSSPAHTSSRNAFR